MTNWKDIPFTRLKADRSLLKEFYMDYEEAFEKPCRSCESKLNSYYKDLINKPRKMENKNKCVLKKGVQLFFDGTKYNANNITDTVSKKMIAANPKLKSRFEVLPSEEKTATKTAKVAKVKEAEVKEAEVPDVQEKKPVKKTVKKGK